MSRRVKERGDERFDGARGTVGDVRATLQYILEQVAFMWGSHGN